MYTPIFSCSFEHPVTIGIHSTLVRNGAPAVSTSIFRSSGGQSIEFVSTGTSVYSSVDPTGTQFVLRKYVYLQNLPSVTSTMLQFINANGNCSFKVTAAGLAELTMGTSGDISTTKTLAINTWYRIDIKVDTSGATATATATIDGASSTTASAAQASTNITSIRFGNITASTWSLNIDDMTVSATIGDYPIGPAMILPYFPTATGTHSRVTAADFLTELSASISNGDSSWQSIDELPALPDLATYIQQVGTDTGYVEYIYGTTNNLSVPMGVAQIVAVADLVSSTANTEKSQLYDGSTAADAYALSTIGSTALIWRAKQWAAPPSGGSWTNAQLRALRVRWGFSNDASPVPLLTATMLEVDLPILISQGFAQAQAQVSKNMQFGQAQANIKILSGLAYGQAQAALSSIGYTSIFFCGFEHSVTTGSHGWTNVGGASVSTIINRGKGGNQSLESNGVLQAQYVSRPISGTRFVFRDYFYLSNYPSSTSTFIQFINANGNLSLKIDTAGLFKISIGTSGDIVMGLLGLNQWIPVDIYVDASTGTATVSSPMYFSTITSTQASAVFTSMRIGNITASTWHINHEDFILSSTPGDYPIGYLPTIVPFGIGATGTHVRNNAAHFITDSGGAITNGDTSWSQLNEFPLVPDTTSYVQQIAPDTGYVEYIYQTAGSNLIPNAIEQIVAVSNVSGTAANTEKSQLYDGSAAADSYGLTNVGSTSIVWRNIHWASAPSGGADAFQSDAFDDPGFQAVSVGGPWTNAKFSNLRLRWGFSDNVGSIPYVSDSMIEVDVFKLIYTTFAQAQAQVKVVSHTGSGQAQAQIMSSINQIQGYALAYIATPNQQVWGQAQGTLGNRSYCLSQAQAIIQSAFFITPSQWSSIGPLPNYLASFNGYRLPGYVQSESVTNENRVVQFPSNYADGSLSQYTGLQNKIITVKFKIWQADYLSCVQEVERAGTILRSKRQGYAPLYLQYTDRHYDAMVKTIRVQKTAGTSSIRILEYEVDFECRPWLIGDTLNILTGSGLSTDQLNRTFADGTWTPATVTAAGTDVSIIGTTETGLFTGSIHISGIINQLIIDSENQTATMFDLNMNDRISDIDYRIFIGPGRTFFQVNGATDIQMTYNNRWVL